jgi:cell division control protein 6
MGKIIKDVDKLDPDYVPGELRHRDEELGTLAELHAQVLESKLPRHTFITGRSGMGKTALATKFFQGFTEEGKKRGILVDLVYVDCKGASPTMVMQHILTALAVQPSPKTCISQLARILKTVILKRNSLLCILIDEAYIPLENDQEKGDALVHCLTRINKVAPGPKACVSVCLISNRDVLAMLEGSTKGMFPAHSIVKLDKYSRNALHDIIVQRVELAFHNGAASKDCLDLIADIASGSGDARTAIELLLTAGMAAQIQGSEVVMPEHVRAAKAEIQPYITENMLRELEEHERLFLLGMSRALRKAPQIAFKEAYVAYSCECEGRGIEARGGIQARKYVAALETRGLIDIKKEGRGKTARWMVAIHDAPVGMLVERLEQAAHP